MWLDRERAVRAARAARGEPGALLAPGPFIPFLGGFVPHQNPISIGSGGSGPTPTFLSLLFQDSADPVASGSEYDYTARLTNLGPNPAASPSVTITLDPDLAFVSSSHGAWSLSQVGQVLTYTQASIAVGPADLITVTVTAPNATETVSCTAVGAATNAGSVSATQTTSIVKVNRDGPENVMLPLTLQEYLVWPLGLPSFVFLPGTASPGPMLDSVQASVPQLAGFGSGIAWQQAFAAWVATFFTTTDNNALAGAGGDLTTLWNFDVQNVTLLTYFGVTAASSRRCLLALNNDQQRVDVLTNGHLSLTRNNITGTVNYRDGLIHPLLIDWQPPADPLGHGPGLFTVRTDKEQIVGTAALPTGTGSTGFAAAGITGLVSPTAQYGPLWGWCATKADTQQLVDQKTRLQSIGWTVTP